MSSEENLEEYGRNVRNDADIIQNALSKRDSHLRRVSFPENDTDLVTGYLEPVDPLRLGNTFDISRNVITLTHRIVLIYCFVMFYIF